MFARITGSNAPTCVPATWNVRASPRRFTRLKNHVHVHMALHVGVALLLTVEGLVYLDNLTVAAERRQYAIPHGLANAVRQEPGSLVRDL